MSQLEDLKPHVAVRGITPDGVATIVSLQWYGSDAIELTFKDPSGRVDNQLLFRDDEPRIQIVEAGRPWSFDGDGALFRLVSEAHRIHLAHLFDPLLAVHTSLVEPLPHQITAVYETMLPRQPLRFLLADDPGAGKTIMAGLLIKELIVRGDLKRCLIVCPGSLAEQWQDELFRRFQLPFEIATNDKLEAARTGNWFVENDFAIARLDKLSRNEDLQAKLNASDCRYDLVVCDEAHKLSATFFGGEVKYTKRYRLGLLLSGLTRHFLLMTATPHNGKEEDFQLFLALLDGDRFEGRFRDGTHAVDVSDLMRRMVKESLLRFDGRPLFPERIAYTVPYKLSDAEARLYKEVTDYVREEFNRAEALNNDKRAGTVGFALTILQRRLASSPEAIYQSLRRRRERLEKRLRELDVLQRGTHRTIPGPVPGTAGVPPASSSPVMSVVPPIQPGPAFGTVGVPPVFFSELTSDDIEDLEDAPENEIAAVEEEILDQATAASTIQELRAEIAILVGLEALAADVRRCGDDKKWSELANVLTGVFTPAALVCEIREGSPPYGAGDIPPPTPSPRQKIVIFTEHRDTLNYLEQRISTLLGTPRSVMVIHGGMGREERRKTQESFLHDPDVKVLLATDAAGEGINLQRAHLMMNYDLPWNPNRLEQRFGRIHRIGQTEVCHLWNLVADETREGDVYRTLLDKLEEARRALGGRVFDVLGKLQFAGRPLRELLIEAVRYGERPETRARLNQAIVQAVDRPHLQDLIEERALAQDVMDSTRVSRVREEMERAEARRLQPHYVESFFLEAFRLLGGTVRQREARRYEITHVPASVRNRDRLIGAGDPVLGRYERAVFEKDLIAPPGQPLAAFICPGHPLLEATLDLTLERHRDLLRRGTVLVDDRDLGTSPRVMFYMEHAVQDASVTRNGDRRTISKRMLYVEASHLPLFPPETAVDSPAQPGTAVDSPAQPGTAGVPPASSSSSLPSFWHSRGYLPHFDEPARTQSITFRLFDAVPERLVMQWREELSWIEGLSGNDPREIELRERLAKYEDAGHGACWLRDERIAALVQEALLHFDGKRYRLIAWCIMPNHVHVLIETLLISLGTTDISTAASPYALPSIVHSWKSFTAHAANKLLSRTGDFWFRDYHDRYIRDKKHFQACLDYIELNPVKAGLVTQRNTWKWSSAAEQKYRWNNDTPMACAAGTAAVPGDATPTVCAAGTAAVPGDATPMACAAGTAAVLGDVPGFRHFQYAPYLDYRPLRDEEPNVEELLSRPECAWISRTLEQQALGHAIAHVVPEHVTEVRDRRLAWIAKTRAAVQDRLTKEIAYWDHRAEDLKLQEQSGKINARLNSQEARRHADELQARRQKRLAELDREAKVSALPPVVLGGFVVIPVGLLKLLGSPLSRQPEEGDGQSVAGTTAIPGMDTQLAATRARAIIMEVERGLGFEPVDRELDKLGYDIESRVPGTGLLRFIEVKGRITGAAAITVTRNEILTSLNKPDDYILAIVEFLVCDQHRVHYVRHPFRREPDFGVTSVNYDFAELLTRAEAPR